MLYHISKLNKQDQDLIKNAPLLVSILIAGADGTVDSEEIERSVSLIHTKAFSEVSDIRHLYKEIDHDVEANILLLLRELPADSNEREEKIIEQLKGLNTVLPKLESHIAKDFYKSLKGFAVKVAQTSGGIFGMNTVNFHEKELVNLPMIIEPVD